MKPRNTTKAGEHSPTTSHRLTAQVSTPSKPNTPKYKLQSYRKRSQSLRILPCEVPLSPPGLLIRSVTLQTLSRDPLQTLARATTRPQFGASVYDLPSGPSRSTNPKTAASIYDFLDDSETPNAVRQKVCRFPYGKGTDKRVASPEY